MPSFSCNIGTVPAAIERPPKGGTALRRCGSAIFASATTLTSTGAVDSFHDSYTSLGGMMAMFNMQLGKSHRRNRIGLYGMLILAVITVFVAGLMVGPNT